MLSIYRLMNLVIALPVYKPISLVCLGLLICSQALAQNDQPLRENWAPSEWGADDKVGAVNRTTSEMVLSAAKLVRQGKVATLGKVYQSDMPLFGARSWDLTIPGLPTYQPMGEQLAVGNDEFLSTQIGQVGTQFDGPGHIGVRTSKGDFFYNGRYLGDPDVSASGLGPLGVEHVAQVGFVCRGVLLDAVAYRGGQLPVPTQRSNDPGIVTPADIEAMIARQGIDPIGEGDSASTEAVAADFGGETAQPFECHLKLMARSGIWNIENLDLSQLVTDKAYEFLFAWSPLKLKGATGSPANPVAIY